MCTVIIHRAPKAPWPALIAANRDEMSGRPWRPPARHWDDHPHIIAGIDEEAGGTWMGVNDDGVLAAVLNRPGSLGPAEGKRSRGELPLEALSHSEAKEAAEALAHLDGRAYRGFNLVIADALDAFWLRSTGDVSTIEAHIIPPGLSMVTTNDMNDHSSLRISRYLPQFQAAETPDPDHDDWSAWSELIANRQADDEMSGRGAMTVGSQEGFGTVCSSLIALPGPDRFGKKPKWLFADGPPDITSFKPILFEQAAPD